LRLYENRVLRRIFGPKRQELGENCTMLGGASNTQGRMRNLYIILVTKRQGTRPLGRPRRRGEENIRMTVRQRGREGVG
jgi:hypothetical protein